MKSYKNVRFNQTGINLGVAGEFVTFGQSEGVQQWKRCLGKGLIGWVYSSYSLEYWLVLVIDHVYLPMFLFFALLDLSPALPYSAREKRRGTSWLTSGQHIHVGGLRKDMAPHLRKEVNPQMHTNKQTDPKLREVPCSLSSIKTLIRSATCQMQYFVWHDVQNTFRAKLKLAWWVSMLWDKIHLSSDEMTTASYWQVYRIDECVKKARNSLIDKGKGGWKQEEDDKNGTQTSKQVEGGKGKSHIYIYIIYMNREKAAMQSQSAGSRVKLF